jgi:hypothetical protein
MVIGFFGGQIDPMLLMTMGFFSFSKVPQFPSNLFINVVNKNEGQFFFSFSFEGTTTFLKSN